MKRIIGDKRGSRISGPRKGTRFSSSEFRKFDWDIDDAPFVGGLVGLALEKSLLGTRKMETTINYKPLKRYLSSQVGRDWNDVLSDIRAALRGADIADANWPHLLSSIVAVRATCVDGLVKVENWCGQSIPLSSSRAPKFYVDPHSGCLHRNTSVETPRMAKKRLAVAEASDFASRVHLISSTRQLHLLADGQWWEVTLTERVRTEGSGWTPVDDVVLKVGLSELSRETLYGRKDVFASAKRQISTREIKRYGLR